MSKYFGKLNFLVIILFILIGTIIYVNSLFNPFIWDDIALVNNNHLIRNFSNIKKIFEVNIFYKVGEDVPSNFYRPLQFLFYMLDYRFWGLNPFGYHLTNIIIHILNAILVYFLISIITRKKPISFIAGFLFIIHPVHTEAVTYISGTADLLVALFMLLSIIFFIIYSNYEKPKRDILYLLAVFCFVLGLLSKELAIVLPLLFLLYDFSFRKDAFSSFIFFVKRYSAFIAIDFIYIALRLTKLQFGVGQGIYLTAYYSMYSRLIIFFHAFNIYFRILFLPLDLHVCRVFTLSLRIFDPITFFCALSFFLSLGLLIYSYEKSRLIFFAGAWYLILLLPQSGIYPINAFMAEHFLYLPSIGIFLIIGFLLTRYCSRKLLIILMMLLAGFYMPITVIRNYEWRKPEPFYKKTIKYSPYCVDAHINLGVYYSNIGLYEEAEKEFQKVLPYKYGVHLIHYNLAGLYIKEEKYDEAIKELNTVLKMLPGFREAEIYNNLGYIYQIKKDYKQAVSNYERALEIKPDFALSRSNLARLYLQKGEIKKGLKEFEEILGIEGAMLSSQRPGPTIEEFKNVIRQDKMFTGIFNEFGILFSKYNRFDVAEKIFKKVIELEPNQADAYFNLGAMYYSRGLLDKAKMQWQLALKVNPRHLPSQEWLRRLQTK